MSGFAPVAAITAVALMPLRALGAGRASVATATADVHGPVDHDRSGYAAVPRVASLLDRVSVVMPLPVPVVARLAPAGIGHLPIFGLRELAAW